MSHREATKLTIEHERRAMELYHRDARARALALASVNYAMSEEIDSADVPPDARQYAHDVATLATAILVSRIYIEDRELAELKAELERLRELTLEGLRGRPQVQFVLNKKGKP